MQTNTKTCRLLDVQRLATSSVLIQRGSYSPEVPNLVRSLVGLFDSTCASTPDCPKQQLSISCSSDVLTVTSICACRYLSAKGGYATSHLHRLPSHPIFSMYGAK
jgi:hypothetical protein